MFSFSRPLLGISLGYFMVLLDTTVLAVAEPDLAASLHTGVAGLQWATTGYTIALAALLLPSGAIADRLGAHRVFRVGVACFGLCSLLSALAPSLPVLVALRGLLGVAAAACVPASMAMIARLYPEPGRRAAAVATWASVSGAAVALGPVVGGVLVGAASWRAVFWVNVPLALVVLALTAGPDVACPRRPGRLDPAAQAAAGLTLALLTTALIAAGGRSWAHAGLAAAAGLAAGTVFALLEARSSAPVVNRALVRTRGVPAALLVGAAVNFAMSGELFVLPLLLHRDLDAAHTGLALLPMTIPFVLLPRFAARRTATRPAILLGMALLTIGATLLYLAPGHGWLTLGLLVTGVGIPFALPRVVAAVVTAAPDGTAGAAGGVVNAVRQVGATLGVSAMGALPHRPALLLAAGVTALAGAAFAHAKTD